MELSMKVSGLCQTEGPDKYTNSGKGVHKKKKKKKKKKFYCPIGESKKYCCITSDIHDPFIPKKLITPY